MNSLPASYGHRPRASNVRPIPAPIAEHWPAVEQETLAAMLREPISCKIAIELIQDVDFYVPAHRALFSLFRELGTASEFDICLGLAEAEAKRRKIQLGGLRSVGQLMELPCSPAQVESLCRNLRDCRRRRDEAIALQQAQRAHVAGDRGRLAVHLAEASAAGEVEDLRGALARMDHDIASDLAGTRSSLPLPWPRLSDAAQPLFPGGLTMLSGHPGATKSLAVLQALWFLISLGIRVACLELEKGPAFHLRRLMAQLTGNANLTRPDWIRANPEEVRRLRYAAGPQLQMAEGTIEGLPEGAELSLDFVSNWVCRRVAGGNRVVVVDPLTLVPRGPRPWDDDNRFVNRVLPCLAKYGASLVCVTHPRRRPAGAKQGLPLLDDIAGGQVFSRAVDCVLWLGIQKPEEVLVANSMGRDRLPVNRIVFPLKTRNGAGTENAFAFWFDSTTLLLNELGVVVEE